MVREYFKLVPERQDNRIVYSEQPLAGPVQTGDVVVVRLTVSATHDEQYLQIEDPIPAGFEFIEQEGLYELKDKAALVGFLLHAARISRRPRARCSPPRSSAGRGSSIIC